MFGHFDEIIGFEIRKIGNIFCIVIERQGLCIVGKIQNDITNAKFIGLIGNLSN